MRSKYLIWSVTVSISLLLAGCTKELSVESHVGSEISVTASTDGGPGTRTTLNGYTTEWKAGDKIGLFSPQAGGVNAAHTAAAAGASTSFNGSMEWGSGAHDFYAYYPHTAGSFAYTAVPVSVPATQTQSAGGNSDHIGALDVMVAAPLKGIGNGGGVSLGFSHVFSLIEFRVVGSGSLSRIQLSSNGGGALTRNGTMDISQATPASGVPYVINSNAAGSSVTLNLSAPVTLTANSATTPALYMMVNPDDFSGDTFTVTATVGGVARTITTPGMDIQRGKKYVFTMDPADADNILRLIPDEGFLAYCNDMMPTWDTNGDGKLSAAEAAAVTDITVQNVDDDMEGYGYNVYSLEGLEHFTGLTDLYAVGLMIDELDVSQNTALQVLQCDLNYITELDLSNNPTLMVVTAVWNELESIDVSQCPLLYYLDVEQNLLEGIDIRNNRTLFEFYCADNPGRDNVFFVEAWFGNNDAADHGFPNNMWVCSADSETVVPLYYSGAIPDIYFSSDYSREGEVTRWNTASVANPIDLVIMGDGFTDQDINSGFYDDVMEQVAENFFYLEPYKSHRHAFNVYSIVATSPNDENYDNPNAVTTFGAYFENRNVTTTVGGDTDKNLQYALEALGGDDRRIDEAMMVVVMNAEDWAGYCSWWTSASWNAMDWGPGYSIAYMPMVYGYQSYQFRNMLNHETGGHGFSKLADEYFYSGTMPTAEKNQMIDYHDKFGWYKNIDFTSNVNQVKWSKLAKDSRFAGESLGAYEGAGTWAYGAWRPTDNSTMNDNTDGFNAPSRESIYYRINKLVNGAGWQYDYETFVAWDMAHPNVYSHSMGGGAGVAAYEGSDARAYGSETGSGVLKAVPRSEPSRAVITDGPWDQSPDVDMSVVRKPIVAKHNGVVTRSGGDRKAGRPVRKIAAVNRTAGQ